MDVRIETESVDTQNLARDEDLRSERFLDAAAYPTMTFVGLSAQPGRGGSWDVRGSLNVRDITLPVTLRSQFLGASGAPRIAFHASAAISRSAFELLTDLARETGGVLLDKDIRIEIDAEATLVSAEGD